MTKTPVPQSIPAGLMLTEAIGSHHTSISPYAWHDLLQNDASCPSPMVEPPKPKPKRTYKKRVKQEETEAKPSAAKPKKKALPKGSKSMPSDDNEKLEAVASVEPTKFSDMSLDAVSPFNASFDPPPLNLFDSLLGPRTLDLPTDRIKPQSSTSAMPAPLLYDFSGIIEEAAMSKEHESTDSLHEDPLSWLLHLDTDNKKNDVAPAAEVKCESNIFDFMDQRESL
ncbi:hypothetical protein HDU67_003718, partial [Dinochytrium kinnereticum]